MEEKVYTEIISMSSMIAEKSKVDIIRDLSKDIINDIKISEKGVFIISGVRGSGKTTILAELYKIEKETIFINAEIILKYGISLLEFLNYSYTKGNKIFLIDEVHVLPDWEKDLKIFYDEIRGKIIVTGSSAITLRVKASELSRRAKTFNVMPLSFREYLYFQTKKILPKISIKELIDENRKKELERTISPYINYFNSYINFDSLPAAFFDKNKDTYINIVERTLRYDLIHLREIDNFYVENTFRMIKVIATSSPGEISYNGLSSSLGIGIKLVREMINSLEQTGLIFKVPPYGKGKKAIRKEEKILMPLSFRSALCNFYGVEVPKGSLREDFFIQHVKNPFYLKTGEKRRTPDFIVEGTIFEVGGPSKKLYQINDFKNSFIVKESLGSEQKEIPLYLFGLLY